MAPPSDSNFFSSTVEERSEGVVEQEWSMMIERAGRARDGREEKEGKERALSKAKRAKSGEFESGGL